MTTNDAPTETGATATTAPEIATVSVVGAGTMGWQIAALTAASGRPVALYDLVPGTAERALERMRTDLPAVVGAAPFYSDLDTIIGNIRVAPSLADAVGDVDLVIEAVREDVATKRALFAEFDPLAPRAILATNSSSLPSGLLVDSVGDPGRLLNLHFFSPVWVRPILEIMGCGATRPEVIAASDRFGRSLGLVTAIVRGESKGFIINRVWRAVKREALRVVDEGHADPEDVDRLWMLFFNTPSGPFGLMDMVGLDVVADIEASYAAVATDPTDRPSPTLERLVAAGKLGEKTGEGFYHHPHPAYQRSGWLHGDDRDHDEPIEDRPS